MNACGQIIPILRIPEFPDPFISVFLHQKQNFLSLLRLLTNNIANYHFLDFPDVNFINLFSILTEKTSSLFYSISQPHTTCSRLSFSQCSYIVIVIPLTYVGWVLRPEMGSETTDSNQSYGC
jgi:hypothetical protein